MMSVSTDDTLQSLLGDLDAHGKRLALARLGHDICEEFSYADLAAAARRLAAGLPNLGLNPGDRVVFLAPNSPAWVIGCLAALEAGLVPVPVDSQMGSEDVGHVLEDSRARWVFTTKTTAQRLASTHTLERLPLVYLDEPGDGGEFWRDIESADDVRPPDVAAKDTAVIFYTSGTSGPPKGVPLTHENIVSNIAALMSLDIVRASDVVLLPLPLHHVYPFVIGLFTPLLMGMSLIVPSSLVGRHFFAALRAGRPSILLGVPRLYEAMLAAVETRFESKGRLAARIFHSALRFSMRSARTLRMNPGRLLFLPVRRRVGPRLRLLISGGSALDPDIAAKLEGLGFRLACGYGLTETSPILTFRSASARGDGHVGQPLPGVRLRIANPEASFEHGEVQAAGRNVFAGYLNLPEKTSEAFTEDGWFRTGDLGYLDTNGCLHLSGRATSMIVMPGGENVDPEKVEQQLERSLTIKEAGVLEHEGQFVAVVVPTPDPARSGNPGDAETALRAEVTRLSRDLPSFQRVSNVVIEHAPLPRTRLGKIRRRELASRYRELLEAGEQTGPAGLAARSSLAPLDRELLEDPVAARVWEWLGERFEGKPVTPDTHMQLDLGVDSLEWLNLTLEIRNRAGVDLADEAVGRIETVRNLLQEAAESKRADELSGGVLELLREPDALLTEREHGWLKRRPWLSAVLDPAAALAAGALMRAWLHFEVFGDENLPVVAPYVIAPNHQSALDPIAVLAAIGRRRLRHTYWGGWVGILFRSRVSSSLSHAMRILPVEPRSGPLSNLALAATVLHRRNNLVWFPEGRRSPIGGPERFRPGIGLLLLAEDVPVVPVWIEGAGIALPPGKLWPKRGRVTVRFGAACRARELEADGEGASPEERIANALRARVLALGNRAAAAG